MQTYNKPQDAVCSGVFCWIEEQIVWLLLGLQNLKQTSMLWVEGYSLLSIKLDGNRQLNKPNSICLEVQELALLQQMVILYWVFTVLPNINYCHVVQKNPTFPKIQIHLTMSLVAAYIWWSKRDKVEDHVKWIPT